MSISFDRAAEAFDRTRGFPCSVMNKIVETLKEELEVYRRILDVAVGTGRFAKPLQDANLKIVGIDISKKMLEKAFEKKTKDLITGDACRLPFHDAAFDASISNSTLHLVKDWKLALQEITRVTKESLFSIIRERPEHKANPSGVYRELLNEYGHSYSHPGMSLGKLKEIIKSAKSRFVTSYYINSDENIALLNEKAFSNQWNAPDDLHRKAMQELRRIFGEKKEYRIDVYVYKWDLSEVKNYLRAYNDL